MDMQENINHEKRNPYNVGSDESMVKSRCFSDTFGGGDYTLDLAENLGDHSVYTDAVRELDRKPKREFYTAEQKELYDWFNEDSNRRNEK